MKLFDFIFNLDSGRTPKGRQMHTGLSFDGAFDLAVAAIKKMNITIGQADRKTGAITAYKGWSPMSDGEVFTVTITPSEGQEGCDLSVKSGSSSKSFDLGVNDKNLEQFEQFFRQGEKNLD